MGTIPNSYTIAEWRNTTPQDRDTKRIGIGFNTNAGEVLRLSLSPDSARHLIETLRSHLMCSHSEMSSEIPSLDVSNPPDGAKV